jgi:hypothetical protein
MKDIHTLVKILLKEAPLSSYVKAAIKPSNIAKGIAKGTGAAFRGTGKVAGALYDPNKSYGAAGGQAVEKIISAPATIGSKISSKFKEIDKKLTTDKEGQKQKAVQKQKTAKQNQVLQSGSFAKNTKVNLTLNNNQFKGKVIGQVANKLPLIQLTNLSGIKSVVIEPRGPRKDGGNNAILYFYAEPVPKRKSKPQYMLGGYYDYLQHTNTYVVYGIPNP